MIAASPYPQAMKTLTLTLLGLFALVAASCRSAEPAAPAMADEAAAPLPEIRYYVIADT